MLIENRILANIENRILANSAREDIRTVRGDLGNLSAARLPAPANGESTISAARAAIRHAIAAAAGDIGTVDADMD